ncbi:hypothetical protein MF4836_23910 [Pseudomonas sp. MF4836]|nr:hypothetical protein MF4836_23910 [Pseudomonas sp. MF4836]
MARAWCASGSTDQGSIGGLVHRQADQHQGQQGNHEHRGPGADVGIVELVAQAAFRLGRLGALQLGLKAIGVTPGRFTARGLAGITAQAGITITDIARPPLAVRRPGRGVAEDDAVLQLIFQRPE